MHVALVRAAISSQAVSRVVPCSAALLLVLWGVAAGTAASQPAAAGAAQAPGLVQIAGAAQLSAVNRVSSVPQGSVAPLGSGVPGVSRVPQGSSTPQASGVASGASEAPTLSLRRATELALAKAPDVAAAAAAAESDRAGARLAGDAFRPAAEASTTPGVGRGLPVAVAGRVPSIVTVDLHQSVYNSEQRSQALSARAKAAITASAYDRVRVQTAREIADLYARCWSGQQLLSGAERRLAAYQAISARAAALHAEARATDLDLAQARLREAKARLRRMEIAAARDVDLWELRRRLGLPADAPLAFPDDPLAGTPEPSQDLRAAVEAARAADSELRSAVQAIELLERAGRLRRGILAQVTVDADAQYSRLSRANGIDQFYVKFREDDWSVALAVAVPLWSGGRLRDGLAQAEAALDRLKQQQRARAEQIEIEVHRAGAAWDHAEAAADLARQAAAVAEEDLRIAGALAAEGRAGADDQDSRAAALADAREEEIKATAGLLAARVQLLAARGELLAGLEIDGGAGGSAMSGETPPGVPPPAPGSPADPSRLRAAAAGSPSPRR
jgi:outer membrane protein TolC